MTRTIAAALNVASTRGPAAGIKVLQEAGGGIRNNPIGLNVLGVLQLQNSEPQQALKAFDAALKRAPTFAEAHCNRGVTLQGLRRNAEALAAYEAALRHQPRFALALFNRGNVLKLLGRLDEAVAAFDAAIAAEPRAADAYANRGLVRLEREEPLTALNDFDAAVAIDAHHGSALIGRASALVQLRRFDEARRVIDGLLGRDPANVEAALVKVAILVEQGDLNEALAIANGVIAGSRPTAKALLARSAVFQRMGRIDQAIADRAEVVRLEPENAREREALAYLYLSVGDFARGFELYEARGWRLDARQRAAELGTPAWAGEDLAGRRLLVLTEQGLGDTLQFVRYLAPLHERGAEITAIVQPAVLSTVQTLKVPVTWSDRQLHAGKFDFHTALLSLPHVLKTRLETIPAEVPYLFADPDKVAFWKEQLGGRQGLKVGIAWQGNPKNKSDHRRSPPLRHFAPLAGTAGVRLISLQGRNGLDQLGTLPPDFAIETLGERITHNEEGIAEIAAVMANLDLIIASDTMTVHLAGALARPVWVVLSHDADWRWLRDRSDCPWYPTMRLFRQRTDGDWAGVFADVAAALAEEAGARR